MSWQQTRWCFAAVLTLWQTNLLRQTRLRVIDGVANGLSHYDHTFLVELPRFYDDLEEQLAVVGVKLADGLPSFLRIGSWIGGNRDGNPFVTEGVLRRDPDPPGACLLCDTISTSCISSVASCRSIAG